MENSNLETLKKLILRGELLEPYYSASPFTTFLEKVLEFDRKLSCSWGSWFFEKETVPLVVEYFKENATDDLGFDVCFFSVYRFILWVEERGWHLQTTKGELLSSFVFKYKQLFK